MVDKNIATITADKRFRDALVAALVTANEQALEADKEGVSVKVLNVGAPVADGVAQDDPKLAKEIRPGLDLPVANTGSTGTLVDVARKAVT